MPSTDVGVSISHNEAVQAIYTLILNNDEFRPDDWSVDQAEILSAAARTVQAGLGRPISPSWPDLLREFSERFGHHVNERPGSLPDDVRMLRYTLIEEEFWELLNAIQEEDIEGIAKEACDLIYVTLGTMLAYGIDPGPIFAAVHRANLTKSQDKREDGKSVKGDGYQPPDIAGLLRAQGWEGPAPIDATTNNE